MQSRFGEDFYLIPEVIRVQRGIRTDFFVMKYKLRLCEVILVGGVAPLVPPYLLPLLLTTICIT